MLGSTQLQNQCKNQVIVQLEAVEWRSKHKKISATKKLTSLCFMN